MSYVVQLSTTARKDILDIPFSTQQRITSVIKELVTRPRPAGRKKLKGLAGMWRMRIGDYRILYGINDKARIVTIYRVLHRKEAYR